jgi:hypothetical protein
VQRFDAGGGDEEFLAQLAHEEALRALDGLERRTVVGGVEEARLALQQQDGAPGEDDDRLFPLSNHGRKQEEK